MISDRDLHTFAFREVWPKPPFDPAIGTLFVEYEVRRLVDVRNLGAVRGYRITMKQRISIPNDGADQIGPNQISSFKYTIMINATVEINKGGTAQEFYLSDVNPKTLNASVSTNVTGSESTNNAATSTVTSGSSTSEVNTFEFGLKLSSSQSSAKFSSNANGHTSGRASGTATADTMAVKDWSSYVSLDVRLEHPRWVWAQAFPWDVIKYHDTDAAGNVVLPPEIEGLLFSTVTETSGDKITIVNPPSAISLFGLNFAMQAEWIYLVNNDDQTDMVSFTHLVAPYHGHHGLDENKTKFVRLTQAGVDQLDHRGPELDLAQLALDPILRTTPANSALVGFVNSQFTTRPSNPKGFSIVSVSNTLLIRGAPENPFDDPIGNDAPMTVDLSGGGASAAMTVYFKIADQEADYSLYLKHWKTAATGVRLTFVVNDGEPIVRFVESMEAGSGSDNITRVLLRRRSFGSDEYFDYLVPGLNKIEITAVASHTDEGPVPDPHSPCGYAIRALAIS